MSCSPLKAGARMAPLIGAGHTALDGGRPWVRVLTVDARRCPADEHLLGPSELASSSQQQQRRRDGMHADGSV